MKLEPYNEANIAVAKANVEAVYNIKHTVNTPWNEPIWICGLTAEAAHADLIISVGKCEEGKVPEVKILKTRYPISNMKVVAVKPVARVLEDEPSYGYASKAKAAVLSKSTSNVDDEDDILARIKGRNRSKSKQPIKIYEEEE